MPLHRLTSLTIGVPDVAAAATFYEDFGLRRTEPATFATLDGGDQMRLVPSAQRRLVEVGVGVDDRDDLERVIRQLRALDLEVVDNDDHLVCREPVAAITAVVAVAERIEQNTGPTPYNYPGRLERPDGRAPGILREGPVRPRKLGHVVIGSTDAAATQRFFTEGLGFKVSDEIKDVAAFMRCSTDHHNVLVQQAPVNYLHHTSWQLDDLDDVGRGAMSMLEKDPERHVWGLGRHYVGSNFFWYLKDPAGNFAEYYSDLYCVVDDELWEPGVYEGAKALFAWGPPPPASMLAPEDLGALMTGTHSPR